jgi:hypothetical protein
MPPFISLPKEFLLIHLCWFCWFRLFFKISTFSLYIKQKIQCYASTMKSESQQLLQCRTDASTQVFTLSTNKYLLSLFRCAFNIKMSFWKSHNSMWLSKYSLKFGHSSLILLIVTCSPVIILIFWHNCILRLLSV